MKSFYYIIIDEDQKLFNSFGPISSDKDWNEKVSEAMQAGRNLLVNSPSTYESFEASIQSLLDRSFKRADFLLVDAPPDRSAEYSGRLPSYAENADRNRIVIIYCETCRSSSYAEMNVAYPGADVLHKTNLGAYFAHCLKCGTKVIDPYNWYR